MPNRKTEQRASAASHRGEKHFTCCFPGIAWVRPGEDLKGLRCGEQWSNIKEEQGEIVHLGSYRECTQIAMRRIMLHDGLWFGC